MLDIKFLRENPEIVKQNIRNKFQRRHSQKHTAHLGNQLHRRHIQIHHVQRVGNQMQILSGKRRDAAA